MQGVTGLFVVVLLFLVGRSRGIEPSGGYCIGNQCFAVFQNPGEFTAAPEQCRYKGGHLMTVRSSVSHDILSILLANATGRFWIGLKLMRGCPDADAAGLRGFQWVTKDTESDFIDWAPGFDNSCSSDRCVSVSREGDFKWMQEACDEAAVGFLCEYSFNEPCKGLAAGQGESVTYVTPMGFGGEHLLSLPPGSIATRLPSETKYVCFSEQWLPAPWNCEIAEGGCEYKCAAGPDNVPSCYCPPGQSVSPANNVTCEVGVHDPCRGLGCQHACYDRGDAHVCICDHGFKLAADGRSCADINECSDERQCPGEDFVCVNTVGGFLCVCGDGYTKRGDQCVDEDECLSAPCEHMCDNTPGSFRCSCHDGHRVNPASPDKCELYCGRVECVALCDPNDASICYCPEGYVSDERSDHTVCIDINECDYVYCDQGCRNTFGSYVCSCFPGYTLVEVYKCQKIEGYTPPSEEGTTTTTPDSPRPGPTRRPSPGVSVGAFVGIIVCTVFCIVLFVCVAHRILNRRWMETESADARKAKRAEVHGLQTVGKDTC